MDTIAVNKRVLFICSTNLQQSRTAEELFRSLHPNIDFKSAGLSIEECQRNSGTPCSQRLLTWADEIYVFDQQHIDKIKTQTGQEFLHKIQNLQIADNYPYFDTMLITLLLSKCNLSA